MRVEFPELEAVPDLTEGLDMTAYSIAVVDLLSCNLSVMHVCSLQLVGGWFSEA